MNSIDGQLTQSKAEEMSFADANEIKKRIGNRRNRKLPPLNI